MKSVKSQNRILWALEYWFKALKCQIWLTNTKLFFWKSKANVENLQQSCPYPWFSYKFFLKSVKSLNWILWVTESWFKVLKCHILLVNTTPVFWESEANVQTLQKRSPYIGVSYKFVLKSVKSRNRILWACGYWFNALKCQIWLTNTKPSFWQNEVNIETVQKRFSYLGVSYKFVYKSVRTKNRILWATKYWFKALKSQIWFTNTKPFSWESEVNVEVLQKPFPYIWFCYKFVLKSLKRLNQNLWATEYRFKALKCQIWLTNTKPFFWENKANIETVKKPSPCIGVSYKFLLKSVKNRNRILWALEYWFNRILWALEYWFNALKFQIWLTNTKPSFWQNEANTETLQQRSSYIGVSYNWFWSQSKP